MGREGFGSLKAGGLDWESVPLRLWTKGNRKMWNAADIDFSQDRIDWAGLSDDERRASTTLAAMFIAGEEAVTEDIQPFMKAMSAEGRLGDEMYLAQFCYEEARHTEAFRRWLDAIGLDDDLHSYVADNPGYRAIFYDALPEALQALAGDPSPAAQVRASVTYNHVVEGTLALTGYFAWNKVCHSRGIMPGIREVVRLIGLDERRHMAWGTYTCRRHVAADPALWEVVEETMMDLLPHALSSIQHVLDQYETPPFGLDVAEILTYAGDRANRRLGAIEAALNADVAAVQRDTEAEDLEDAMGAEDEAATLQS